MDKKSGNVGAVAPVTLADVANAAGVSVATVSAVLNKRSGAIRTSTATRERIEKLALDMGYLPNPFAKALQLGKTGVIGVLARDIGGTYTGALLSSLRESARQNGYEILASNLTVDTSGVGVQLSIMQSHLFDGVLIVGDSYGLDEVRRTFRQSGKPFVSIGPCRPVEGLAVGVDAVKGTRLALEHLYEHGHRRIGFVGDVARVFVKERIETYERFCAQYRLRPCLMLANFEVPAPSDLANIVAALTKKDAPTGVFFANDSIAVRIVAQLWPLGRRIPEDLSVVGFDDSRDAEFSVVGLTTVNQPHAEIGRVAIELLIDTIGRTELAEADTYRLIAPRLTIRESVAAV